MADANAEPEIDLDQFRRAAEWLTLTTDILEGRDVRASGYWRVLVDQSLTRCDTKPSGLTIFRARTMSLAQEDDAEPLGPHEMGSPPPAQACAQRLSPSGVPCFYGALDADTAIAEVRPWRRARVSVAKFVSLAPLRLVDLSTHSTAPTSPALEWLNFILGRPVHRDDTDSYRPSQMLAEELRRGGAQGMLYDSALRPGGVNAAIFEESMLSCGDRELVQVSAIRYSIARL